MCTCNLCGGTEVELVYPRKNIKVISKKESFCMDIHNVICRHCGLVFQYPPMDKGKLASFYANQYRQSVNDGSGGAVREQQKAYVDSFLEGRKGSILDIGCFEGYFLHLFQKDGWEVTGVEPCEKAAKICKDKYSIQVYTGMFEDVDFEGKKFDLISIRHVLEHVDDPMGTLVRMKERLKENGLIFVEVPNISQFDYNNIADYFDFQHIYNFSIPVLTSYMNKLGLKVLDIFDNLKYAGVRLMVTHGQVKDILPDYENTKRMVLTYKQKREENLHRMRTLLNEKNVQWKKQSKKIGVYGAGFHTAQLFDYVIHKEDFNIMGLFDMSDEKEGKEFFGYPTFHAKKIRELKPDVVLISSYAFQDEIYEYLKPLDASGIEVIKLYENTFSYDTMKNE